MAGQAAMVWRVGWRPAAAQEEGAQGGPLDCVIEPREVVELGSAEIPCASCGGSMTLPAGADSVACPFCQAEVRRAGIR